MARLYAAIIPILALLAASSLFPAPAAAGAETPPPNPLCRIETSMGEVTVELFARNAPKTVENFIGLAEGKKPFKDPTTGKMVTRPYYDGLVFHRIIKDFMIQGGCPLGTGTGGPGYRFEDEIDAVGLGLDKLPALASGRPHPILMIRSQRQFQQQILMPLFRQMKIGSQEELDQRQEEVQKRIDRLSVMEVLQFAGYQYSQTGSAHPPLRGFLAMANSGPGTNGSQFFINLVDTEWLKGRHTVFGRVVEGMDLVDRIGAVAVDERSRPVEPVKIVKIRIIR